MVNGGGDSEVRLSEVIGLLGSRDIKRYWEVGNSLFGSDTRYCSNEGFGDNSVVYATFPRSGNSMVRKYLENITGINREFTQPKHPKGGSLADVEAA